MELEKPVSGSEGGGVGGYSLSRIPQGPGQAAQQDPKSQPQQSLPPGSYLAGAGQADAASAGQFSRIGSMQGPVGNDLNDLSGSMSMYQPNPRGGQQQYYQTRPQQRLQNNAPRLGGVQQMQGTAVFAALPSGNMYPQPSIGQVPTSIIIPPVYHMAARHHGQATGQAASNQQQNYYQLPPQYMAPQSMGPPPFPNYGPVYVPQQIRSQFTTQNSTQNQVPQQQPAPQQSAVQPLYVEQVGGGPQVTMSSMSGGPGGPNGTPHILGPQAPNSISLVQNPGAISSGATMLQNPQLAKEKKVRKFAIPIIDPDSGQNVLLDEEKDGVTHSADSSASHTPQPQIGKEHDDIKAKQVVGEFAFKVAAVAFVDPALSAAAPAPALPAPLHIEERLNGPVDHSHENELVKELSPTPPTAVTPQLSAPQLSASQLSAPQLSAPQLSAPQLSAPHLPAPQLSAPQLPSPQPTAPQPPPQQHPAPSVFVPTVPAFVPTVPPFVPTVSAFVPTVSASTNSPLVELHRPSAPSMSAVVKQLPPGSSGPPLLQQTLSQAPTPAPVPSPVAHPPAPALVATPVPLSSTSPLPRAPSPAPTQAPSPAPTQAPSPAPQTSPAPTQTAPPPQASAPVRKAQVMGPPTESAVVPTKKGSKKETGSGAGSGAGSTGGAGRGAPTGGRPGSVSTPPPAATTTVVGPPPAPAGAPKSNNFSEMTNFKNFAPSSNPTAPAPAPAPTPAPAPAPVEEKGTNGETEPQVGKAIQRPKQKKGGKVRGVDKGGTEMDAFVEPAPTPAAAPPPARDPTPPPPREPTPPAPEPKARPVETPTAPVIEQLIQPEVEAEETESVTGDDEYSAGTDMDAMVAAKNEENAKVSAAAAAAAANNNNNITSSVGKEDNEVVADGEADEDESNSIKSMTIERSPSASQALKYNYRDGQWSPVNREGKKVYDRDFLMEIKNSTLARQKPEFALELDIFRDKPNDYPPNNNRKNIHGSISMGSRGDNPSPYRSSGSSNQRGPMIKMPGRDRGPPRGGMGASLSQSGMRGMGGGKGGYVSVNSQFMTREPEPVLHKDPNGWKPTHRQQGTAAEISEEQKQIEKLQKNIRGILNKLTPQKFEKLVAKILELPINTEDHLREMVNLVFEKAVDEPSFSKAYADLCHRLQKKVIQRMENSGENNPVVAVTFRKLLLNKCQEGFEKNKKDELDIANRVKEIEETADPEKKKELKLLLDEDERKIRRKSVGLVRFIGELYKLHMLTPKIMHGCISTLLSQVAEEPLECLCKLLTTIGKELERESGKKEFDEYFAQMSKLAQKTPDSKVSSRIRFMLQDVIELRQKNWKPRRDENNPKTIEQIHKDAERDAAMESAMLSAPMHQGPKGRHPSDGRRNPRTNQDSDGWQMSGNKYRTGSSSYTNTVEASKLQHFKSDAGDAGFSLGGSGAFSQWTSGASTKRPGGLADQNRSGPPPSNNVSANRFALLGQADSSDSRMKYSSSMGGKGKGVSGSTSLEKDSRSIGGSGMMRGERDRDDMRRGERDRDDMRRMGSGPSSRENSRPRYAQSGHSPAGSLSSRMERDFTRSEQPSSRGGYQVDNREATEARVPPASVADLDEDDGKRKAETIFDEWCANNSAEETLLTISDTFIGQKNGCLLVRLLLEKVIEGKPHSRTKYAELLVVMLQEKKLITSKDVITEFQSMIEYGDDMVVDIPFFWSHFGHIFAPLISNEVVTFDELKTAMDERSLADRAKVVSEVFRALQQNEKTSVWTSSNAKLTDFVPENEIDDFVKSNNFWFLAGNAEPTGGWRKHRDNLVTILQADSDKAMDDAHAFLAKIEGSVSKKAFIEIVTMAVIKASLKEDKLVARQISKFDKLILKYVDNTEELELICLFAIKNFVVKEATLELSVLTESFKHLYDDSIISVEAFKKWKDDTSIELLGSEGRLLATKALEPFYVFLAEPDDEEEES